MCNRVQVKTWRKCVISTASNAADGRWRWISFVLQLTSGCLWSKQLCRRAFSFRVCFGYVYVHVCVYWGKGRALQHLVTCVFHQSFLWQLWTPGSTFPRSYLVLPTTHACHLCSVHCPGVKLHEKSERLDFHVAEPTYNTAGRLQQSFIPEKSQIKWSIFSLEGWERGEPLAS